MKSNFPIHTFTDNVPDGYLINVEKVEFLNSYENVNPHRHDYYELFVFADMNGQHFVDFERFPIQKQSVHLLLPNQVHRVERNVGSGFVIMFKKEVLKEFNAHHQWFLEAPFFNRGKSLFTACFSDEEFSFIWQLCTTIVSAFSAQQERNKEVIQTLLEALLLKIKTSNESADSVNAVLLRHYLLLLDQHFIAKQSAAEYARLLRVSPAQLNAECNKTLGISASQLIYEKLILESKRLLVSTSWTAKEIAYHLNFSDPAYFNRFFKKHSSMSPAAFRKRKL